MFCGWFASAVASTGGGAAWHVPHVACDAPLVQFGVRALVPPISAPPGEWQYVFAHVVPLHVIVRHVDVASAPQPMSTVGVVVARRRVALRARQRGGPQRELAHVLHVRAHRTLPSSPSRRPRRPAALPSSAVGSAPFTAVRAVPVLLPWQPLHPSVAPHCGSLLPWHVTLWHVFVVGL